MNKRLLGTLAAALPVAAVLWLGTGHPGLKGSLGGRVAGLGGQDADAAPPAPTPIGGSSTAQYRSTYTLKGRTGGDGSARAAGVVRLRGRWNRGAWTELAHTRTDRLGHYRLSIVLRRHGTLELRLLPPDGATFTKTLNVA